MYWKQTHVVDVLESNPRSRCIGNKPT